MSEGNQMVDRNTLRASIFKGKKLKRKEIEFFGQTIEIQQPSLGAVISASEAEDRQAIVIETLIKYAYIPGTDVLLFESGDAATFAGMPFGADFTRVIEAIQELSEVNFQDKKPSS